MLLGKGPWSFIYKKEPTKTKVANKNSRNFIYKKERKCYIFHNPFFLVLKMFFNLDFDSTVDTSINPLFLKSPNPNPNFDQVAYEILHYQLEDDILCFKDVSDYLMSEENSEERDLSENKRNLKKTANSIYDESSSLVGNKQVYSSILLLSWNIPNHSYISLFV